MKKKIFRCTSKFNCVITMQHQSPSWKPDKFTWICWRASRVCVESSGCKVQQSLCILSIHWVPLECGSYPVVRVWLWSPQSRRPESNFVWFKILRNILLRSSFLQWCPSNLCVLSDEANGWEQRECYCMGMSGLEVIMVPLPWGHIKERMTLKNMSLYITNYFLDFWKHVCQPYYFTF